MFYSTVNSYQRMVTRTNSAVILTHLNSLV